MSGRAEAFRVIADWSLQNDPGPAVVRPSRDDPAVIVYRNRGGDPAADDAIENQYRSLAPPGIEVRFAPILIDRCRRIAVQKVLSAAFQDFCALGIHLLWWGVMDPCDPFEIHVDETGRIPDLAEVRRVSGLSEELITDDLIRIKPSPRVSLAWRQPAQ